MTNEIQHSSGPRHAKIKKSPVKRALIVLLIIACLAALGAAAFYVYLHYFSSSVTSSTDTNSSVASNAPAENAASSDAVANMQAVSSEEFKDRSTTAKQDKIDKERAEAEAAAKAAEEAQSGLPTPLIAQYEDVLVHTPIRAQDLEGVLFHQAATDYGLVLSTQLAEANPESMLENPDYEIAEEQPTGDEWLNALALHLWRADTTTEMDTSIDVGAEAGTQVYAPVTGTVVLVRTYNLYDVVDDYEIHIQPDGRPDLDVVEIHVQDVSVKAGDKVVGGQTLIAKVRDLAAEDITDIQLAFYTKEGHGNHTHVQVNNADAPEYRETRLKDAYKVE